MASSMSLSFSSYLVSSAFPHPETISKTKPHPPNSVIVSSALAGGAVSDTKRQRHWKEGEYPCLSQHSVHGPSKKPPSRISRRNSTARTTPRPGSPPSSKPCPIASSRSSGFKLSREQPFYQPKECTYMKLLVLLGKSGQPHRARQLFDEMIEEGCEPTPELYTAMLASYCRNNLIDEAFSTLNQMKTLPTCQPDVFTYSTLIKACVDASLFDLVEYLYGEMDERLITPNTITQNIVLSGYGKVGKFDQMEKVLSKVLGSSACKPDLTVDVPFTAASAFCITSEIHFVGRNGVFYLVKGTASKEINVRPTSEKR
ncbi:hypothetical protein GQ457_07G011050 [Hibiscus cannabinus]